jgi:hypothetical protein
VVGPYAYRATLAYMLADLGDRKDAMVRVLEAVAR